MSIKHTAALLSLAATATAAGAQTSIGPNGIRSRSTVIDSTGVHTATADVGARGVRTHGSRLGGQTILTNGRTRSIDCAGKALTLEGNSNHLTLSHCSAVQIDGNSNIVSARFEAPGRIAVNGNHNAVIWSAAPRVSVAVSNVGTRNSVVRR